MVFGVRHGSSSCLLYCLYNIGKERPGKAANGTDSTGLGGHCRLLSVESWHRLLLHEARLRKRGRVLSVGAKRAVVACGNFHGGDDFWGRHSLGGDGVDL